MSEQETKHIALISVIITSELYRPLLMKSLLSHEQVDHLISEVCIWAAKRFDKYITNKGDLELIYPRESVISFAKGYILTEKGIRL